MNYSLVAIALLPLFGLMSGCQSASNKSEVRAEYIDKRPAGDESWTEARVASLEKYAYDLMTYSGNEKRTNNELEIVVKDHFKRIGVTDYKPLNSYKIKLGTANECFWEGTSDYDLWWPNHLSQMKSQIEQVAIFVKDFHLQTLGAYDGAFAFKEVLVCPQSIIKTPMTLDGYILKIGVKYSSGQYVVQRFGEIMQNWNDGLPIGLAPVPRSFFAKAVAVIGIDKASVGMRLGWKIFNPLSKTRDTLRKQLQSSGKSIFEIVADLKDRFIKSNRSQLETLKSQDKVVYEQKTSEIADSLREAIDNDLNGMINSAAIPKALVEKYENFGLDKLESLLSSLSCYAGKMKNHRGLEKDSMMIAQSDLGDENNYIDKDVAAGLVAVVNHHRIAIGINWSTGTGRYNRYIARARKRSTTIKTKVRAGWVAVDTSDDISVNVNMISASLPTLSFDNAISATVNNQDLCL